MVFEEYFQIKDVLRYVFLVLNTLQGLFILVFFTCSKKVTVFLALTMSVCVLLCPSVLYSFDCVCV